MSKLEETDEFDLFEDQLEATFDAFERNMEAQARFVESWVDAIDTDIDDDAITDGFEGYAKAYQTWMEAAENMVQSTADAAEGEEVDFREFRDIWLHAANQAFKDVMETTAFASATGETVGTALELKKQIDDAANDTLRELGFATANDVEEIGERLVELERRQHSVEKKIDQLLERVE